MNPKYLTSLELSKKLKGAGVKQESEYYWEWSYEGDSGKIRTASILVPSVKTGEEEGICSAFHVGELGEMLPAMVNTNRLQIDKLPFGDWFVSYIPYADEAKEIVFGGPTEAETRGKMVLYLKENGLI